MGCIYTYQGKQYNKEEFYNYVRNNLVQPKTVQKYNKILFPSGNTASRIEGHTTLEEFKKQKEERLAGLLSAKIVEKDYESYDEYTGKTEILPYRVEYEENSKKYSLPYKNKVDAQKAIDSYNIEINQLKQELERVETEGFGALKPIYNFYENTVTNILKKQGFSPIVITDEYGNTWNEITIDVIRDNKSILLQKEGSTVSSKASTETLNLVKEAAKRLGIDITTMTTEQGRKMGVNGFSNVFAKLVGVVEGKETTTLPEEVMHVVVALLKQKNSSLYKKFLGDITDYVLYKEVFAEYSKLKEYQLPNGKPDVVKIKEEAVAKLLVEMLIKENEMSLENPQKLAKTKSLWNQFVEWFNTFLNKLGLDYKKQLLNSFETTSSTQLLQDDYTGITAENNGNFLQATPITAKADEIWNKIQERSKDVQKTKDGYLYKGVQMAKRVTELVSKRIDPFTKKKAEETKESIAGTAIHADLEDILSKFIDPTTGLLRQTPLPQSSFSQAFPDNMVFYNVLYDYIKVFISEYPVGTRFVLEKPIVNEDKSLGGTVDFLAILPSGEIDVIDWKSMFISDLDPLKQTFAKGKYINEQLKIYVNDILKPKYGVDKVRKARAIPIQTKFDKFGTLFFIRIGDPSLKDETVEHLLPITTELEKTEDANLNKLIDKLQKIYTSISERSALNKDYRAKSEQLKSLFKAIQQLKLKKNFIEIGNQFDIMSFTANKLMSSIKNIIESNRNLSLEEMNSLAENLLKVQGEFKLVQDLDNDLVKSMPTNTEEEILVKNKLLASASTVRVLIDDLNSSINDIMAYYAKQNANVDGLLNPEVAQNSQLNKFNTLSKLQTKASQVLSRFIQRIQRLIEQEITDFYLQFKEVASGITKEDASLLIKKENGKGINKLIDKYRYTEFKNAFQSTLKKAEESKNLSLAVNWVKDNIDVEKFKERILKEAEEEIQKVENYTYRSNPEEDRAEKDLQIAKIKEYSNFNNDFVWLNEKNNLRFPSSKWETAEYIKLKSVPKAFALYNMIRDMNKRAHKAGYLHYSQTRNFLPFVEKSMIEAIGDKDFQALPTLWANNWSTNVNNAEYGQQNKLTGQIEDVIPKYFTSEIENYSTDILKNFQIFAQQVISYEHKSNAEHVVKLLENVERNKASLEVNGRNLTGNLIDNNDVNADIILDYVKNYFYGQKYTDSKGLNVNLSLGKSYNIAVDKINKKLGINIPKVSEKESEKELSLVKILDNFNNIFTLKTLGLKPTTSIVNFLGSSAQAHINAGKYYTKSQHLREETTGVKNKFIDADTEIALLNLFNPYGMEEIRRELDKLSIKSINKNNYNDVLMILMRKPEEYLRYVNFKCFLNNAIVVNNQLVNARVYYRNSPEYKARYSTQNVSELESSFEIKVAQLIEKQGIKNFISLNNNKLEIKASKESINDYITLTKTIGARNTGSLQPGDNMRIKMNVFTNSFMVFKTWIPSLMDQRFGSFKYDANTDSYEYGRVRSAVKILVQDYNNAFSNFSDIYKGTSKGVALLEQMWEQRKEAYKNETGQELDDSKKEEYFDLIRSNLKNLMTEMLSILTILSMIVGASFIPPEDELESNEYKLFVRTLDRLKGELMFFYNPMDFEHFVNGNLFPAFGILRDLTALLNNFTLEAFGTVFQNEEWKDKAHPLKYTMKLIPGANASLEYLPIFLPEWSQEAGITIKKEISQ